MQPDVICADKKIVREVFRAHLKTLQHDYQLQTADEEVREEMAVKAQRENVRKAREHRQREVCLQPPYHTLLKLLHQLRGRRADICRIFSGKLPQSKSLKTFDALWRRMPPSACSEDEAFIRNNKLYYRKIRPQWRSTAPEVEDWFRTFDDLHMSTRFQASGKRRPGRLPRYRLPALASTAISGQYPMGLPSNFYDQAWCDSLDDFEKEQLKPRKPIDLIFDDRVKA